MKRKLIALGLAVALIGVSVVSGTLAYLTDSDEAVNVFAVGDVDIEITEDVKVLDAWGQEVDGKIKQNGTSTEFTGILPTYTIQKPVTVTNTGDEAAYVRAVVILNNADTINAMIDDVYENTTYGYTEAQVQAKYDEIFVGWGINYTHTSVDGDDMRGTITGTDVPDGVLKVDTSKTLNNYINYGRGNWFVNPTVEYKGWWTDSDDADPMNGYYSSILNPYEICYAYYIYLEPGESVKLFDGLKVPAEFNNKQIKMFEGLNIEVYADAIQAEGFVPQGVDPENEAVAKEAFVALNNAHTLAKLRNWDVKTATNATELMDAINSVMPGDKVSIKLTDNVTLSNTLEIIEGATVKLDLGGKTITSNVAAINNYGTLIVDGNNGAIDVSSATDKAQVLNNYGTLVVNGGAYKGTEALYSYTIRNYGNATLNNADLTGGFGGIAVETGAKAVINDGTYTMTGNDGGHLVYLYSNGTETAELVVNGGTFTDSIHDPNIWTYSFYMNGADTKVTVNGGNITGLTTGRGTTVNGGKGTFTINGGTIDGKFFADEQGGKTIINGGTFTVDPTNYAADPDCVVDNNNGTWTVIDTSSVGGNVEVVTSTDAFNAALANTETNEVNLYLTAGTYKMPSVSGSKEITITGTKDTVIDLTLGAYMDSANVSFNGVTINGNTGYANGASGGDYAALYTPNVTYTNCTFDGPFRIGRDGATFINCTFTNLGNDYVWTYGNDATFENCTFESSNGKALLIYKDGGSEISKVTVSNCKFIASVEGYAYQITNQQCAAIEIDNSGCGVDLTISNITANIGDGAFSGYWRIKSYPNAENTVTINGIEYTQTALDGENITVVNSQVQ